MKRIPFGPIKVPIGFDIIKFFDWLIARGLWPADRRPFPVQATHVVVHETCNAAPLKLGKSVLDMIDINKFCEDKNGGFA